MPKVKNTTNRALVCGPFVLQVNEERLFDPHTASYFKKLGAEVVTSKVVPAAAAPEPEAKPEAPKTVSKKKASKKG